MPADRTAQGGEGFFRERGGSLGVEHRRVLVDRRQSSLSLVRQCQLWDINRSGLYYQPIGVSDDDLNLMKLIDKQCMVTPFYGARKFAVWLKSEPHRVNRKHVRRLMQLRGLRAIYRRPLTSKSAPGNKIYPYLLNGLKITRPNQVWCADVTYIPMARGFLYLVVIMDWHSRYVLSWRLSNTLGADFCFEALEEALRKGRPDIFNTDQGTPNSLARLLQGFWNNMESRSAWMGKVVIETTCLLRGHGGR